ncbi:MAG: hypothetical protein B6I20_04945 [Bacteroidetes bacterium 4572_117]|nr:MAG: hypothetical protein B6I20_04945 [Bacteroidetes bacterium 4572_117]
MTENKPKILIVDDFLLNIQIIGKILADTDYNISYATDGVSAIEKVSNVNFDLILLDIMMPEMDGFELCRILKKEKKTKDIPVVFLTAKADEKSIIEGLKAGGQDYISKPFHAQELLARIKTHLKLKFQSEKLSKIINELSYKNEKIKGSIRYAKIIQAALFPSIEKIKNDFDDFFLIFKPKDIVSGDFYWYHKTENYQIYIIADCTGHGVPGAMLSMAGKTFLDRIVKYDMVTQPDEILNKLNELFLHLLKHSEHEITDGMEISVFKFDKQKQQIQFSAAGQDLLYFNNNDTIVIKGDKMSIGGFEKEYTENYKLNIIDIEKGNNYKFYMYTDGYIDQIGGDNGKRFTKKGLKKLIAENKDKTMPTQETKYRETLAEWINNYKQMDDITFTGFSILG